MSRDALVNLSRLPRMAYGLLNGETVTIARGAPSATPVCIPPSLVDTMNAKAGVTRFQRLAMEAGVTLGWTSDAADPDYHARVVDEPVQPKRVYTVIVPLKLVLNLEAVTDQDAIDMALEMAEIPYNYSIELDGVPSIIDEVEIPRDKKHG